MTELARLGPVGVLQVLRLTLAVHTRPLRITDRRPQPQIGPSYTFCLEFPPGLYHDLSHGQPRPQHQSICTSK